MPNKINNSKLPLGEIAKKTNISAQSILYWEKKGLIKSQKAHLSDRLFDVSQILKLSKRLSSKNAQYGFTVHKAKATNFSVVELFSGAGGLALGLSNAGFKTKLLVEFDKDAIATLRQNRPDWNCVHDDIRNVDFSPYSKQIDVVAGGFPCQAFSYAGAGKGLGI